MLEQSGKVFMSSFVFTTVHNTSIKNKIIFRTEHSNSNLFFKNTQAFMNTLLLGSI